MVDDVKSEPCVVTSGVPQCSVLGPILFLLYINNISSVHLSNGSELRLFADDILLLKPILSRAEYVLFQEDINNLFLWSVGKNLF